MPVKRFIAADMRRALTMVREELGEDAMIMSTERTKKGVELIASADDPNHLTKPPKEKIAASETAAPKTPFSKTIRSRDTRLTPRIEPNIATNMNLYDDQSRGQKPQANSTRFGLASGKTREQLADELELAREKMLASKRQENITLDELKHQNSALEQPQSHYVDRNRPVQSRADNHPSVDAFSESIEGRLDQLIEKTTREQEKVTQKTDEDIRELQHEIHAMRSLFEEQLAAMADMQKQHFSEARSHREVVPMAQLVKQRLGDLGLTQHCNDAVLKSLKSLDSQTMSAEGLWKESLARLSHRIKTHEGDLVQKGGVFAFWGPTGVGKTTTIAKLAARHVIDKGTRNIVLLSTDRFRIAAHDQLKSLGKILNVSVKVVDNLKTLPQQLKTLSQHDLVLIDTPGMNQQDALFKEHLQIFRRCRGIHHVLVLSANSQYQMMQACVHSYRAFNISSCVLTKLDECASLGDGISVLAMNKLPLSYITDGQSVPEDIATIRPHQLVTKAVSLSRQYSTKLHSQPAMSMPETV